MDLNTYKIDPQIAEEGSWIELDAVTSLLVRRYSNAAFKRRWQALLAPYKHSLQRGTLADEVQNELLTRALADEVLVGWKGLLLDGKDIKYSADQAYKIMIDPAFTEFRDQVVALSQDIDNFRQQEAAVTEEK